MTDAEKIELYGNLYLIIGDGDTAVEWLGNHNKALNGVPNELIAAGKHNEVIDYLRGVRAR